MRRWVINGRFLTQPLTGVQRYAREVVAAMDRLLAEGHPLGRGLRLELVTPPGAPLMTGLAEIGQRPAGRLSGHLWEQVSLPLAAPRRVVNLCNTAPLMGRDAIVCIHDTNVFDFPVSYSPRFRMLYGVLIPRLARRTRFLATVSDYSAGRIAAVARRRGTIAVLPNGHEHVHAWRAPQTGRVDGAAASDTIILLGSRAPHKNMDLLIGLAGRLADQGFRLMVVGGLDAGVFRQAGGRLPVGVTLAGRVDDDALAALLGQALCLAFPSYVEGFGLPVLEALALGCPVVSSDRASLPEVGGDAVLYADPDSPDAWLAAFSRLRADGALRAALIERGRERARRFSWRRSALGYLRLMAEADGLPAEEVAAAEEAAVPQG